MHRVAGFLFVKRFGSFKQGRYIVFMNENSDIEGNPLNQSGFPNEPSAPKPEPAFLIPTAMIWLVALLGAIHLIRLHGPENWYFWSTAYFSFLPIRFNLPLSAGATDYGVWLTPFSHAFLHGDWTHLAVNCFWMVAFATPVLRRLGFVRFFMLFLGSSAAGALFYFVLNDPYSSVPMVGASGAVSGFMGAAARFAFTIMRPGALNSHLGPRLSLLETLTDRTTVTFIFGFAIVNAVTGVGLVLPDGSAGIAWEAHLGGFVFGLLAFAAFDRNAQIREGDKV